MTRARLVLALVALLALAGCATPEGEEVRDPPPAQPVEGYEEDFESTLVFDQWARGAFPPFDAEAGEEARWDISRSVERARSGEASMRFALAGDEEDGTLWIERVVDVESGRAYRVQMTAHAWADAETEGDLVLYASPVQPMAEDSFTPGMADDIGAAHEALRAPLTGEGWQTHTLEWTTPELQETQLWTAVGVTATWDEERVFYVDDVTLRIEPVEEA